MHPATNPPISILPRPALLAGLLSLGLVLLGGCAGTADRPESAPSAGEPPLLSQPPPGPPTLREGHPKRYTVVPGDTLWDIAGRFLEAPWRWPELWRINPDIRNPHLIYPGDTLEVFYEDDQPRVRVADTAAPSGDAPTPEAVGRTADGRPIFKLNPRIRVEALNTAVPPIPREAVAPFISGSLILREADWLAAPYLVAAADDRVLYGAGDLVYARGNEFDQPRYRVFHPGAEYHDPQSGEFLGFEVIHVGEARLEQDGDPAVLRLVSTEQAVSRGDRLLPPPDDPRLYEFVPHAPPADIEGSIVAVPDGVALIGRYKTVVLDLGAADGIEPGHVLGVYSAGGVVQDPITGEPVPLPAERAGLLMVYRAFDRASYALVTEATQTIRVLDRVAGPGERL